VWNQQLTSEGTRDGVTGGRIEGANGRRGEGGREKSESRTAGAGLGDGCDASSR